MESKIMAALDAPNIRQLVANANELGISREDVVTILSMKEGYMLIYYEGRKN